jgi:hypothetical protein
MVHRSTVAYENTMADKSVVGHGNAITQKCTGVYTPSQSEFPTVERKKELFLRPLLSLFSV